MCPDPDGVLQETVTLEIRHYLHHQSIFKPHSFNHPDPIVFLPLTVDTSGRICDDYIRLIFLHTDRETSSLDNELPEESDQFRFRVLHTACLPNLKGSVDLIFCEKIGHEDFYTARLFISTFYTTVSFHSF